MHQEPKVLSVFLEHLFCYLFPVVSIFSWERKIPSEVLEVIPFSLVGEGFLLQSQECAGAVNA